MAQATGFGLAHGFDGSRPGLDGTKARAVQSQAKAVALGPGRAGTSLPDGNGDVYVQSDELYLVVGTNRKEISRTMCSVIAGIIPHWTSDIDVSFCCRRY